MAAKVTTFLMFEGKAEAAMTFYVSLFDDGAVTRLERFGPEGPGAEGSILQGAFTLGGREFRCFDSPVPHGFTFTPSMSLFVDCTDETQLERLYAALSEGGQVLMELGDYGFSRRFGWVNDRFGVSWQINLPSAP
jgi:predicted 3-demethylubiquinone-9 3-methyltransferase (glyoxalase superfamily)